MLWRHWQNVFACIVLGDVLKNISINQYICGHVTNTWIVWSIRIWLFDCMSVWTWWKTFYPHIETHTSVDMRSFQLVSWYEFCVVILKYFFFLFGILKLTALIRKCVRLFYTVKMLGNTVCLCRPIRRTWRWYVMCCAHSLYGCTLCRYIFLAVFTLTRRKHLLFFSLIFLLYKNENEKYQILDRVMILYLILYLFKQLLCLYVWYVYVYIYGGG